MLVFVARYNILILEVRILVRSRAIHSSVLLHMILSASLSFGHVRWTTLEGICPIFRYTKQFWQAKQDTCRQQVSKLYTWLTVLSSTDSLFECLYLADQIQHNRSRCFIRGSFWSWSQSKSLLWALVSMKTMNYLFFSRIRVSWWFVPVMLAQCFRIQFWNLQNNCAFKIGTN